MAVDGASPFVQTVFPDQVGLGLPGTIYKPSYHSASETKSFPAGEGPMFCGRIAIRGTNIDYTNSEGLYSSPFSIRPIVTGDTTAADFVGVVVRPISGAQNFVDTQDSDEKAGFGKLDKLPILKFGSKVEIIVRQSPGLGAIDHGAAVYVAKDAVNDALVKVGEFATNALGATGLVLVPNAIWFIKKTSTVSDPIGVIQLL